MTTTGIIRTVGLWVLIIATAASTAIDFTQGNSVWGWFKLAVALAVIAFEIGRYLLRGETISTKYKKFLIAHPMWAWASLLLFALGLTGLIVHLSFW